MRKEFYVYTFTKTVIVGNGSSVQTIRLGNEPFELVAINGYATSLTGATIEFKVTNKGRVLSDKAVSLDSVCGTGRDSFYLPEPLMLDANSNLEITVTDISGSTNTVAINLIGNKLSA